MYQNAYNECSPSCPYGSCVEGLCFCSFSGERQVICRDDEPPKITIRCLLSTWNNGKILDKDGNLE